MAPGFLSYIILHLFYLHHISFTISQSLLSNLYNKIPKIFILLSLSDLTFASDHEGIDNPFITLVARFLIFVQVLGDWHVVSYWIDTLVLKN